MHQLNQNLYLEFFSINLYRITIQTRGVWEQAEVVEWRWQSEGKDGNGAMAVQEIVDSNTKIYLIILNKELCKEKRETDKTCETINPTYTTFSFTCQEPKCRMQHENTKP
jgi:hypothetical protein